ncbi:MAG: aspartyl protease family protein [Sphingosinicella sp.]|nr:aspartyl protease family protein [Sphingosinicella sp.]
MTRRLFRNLICASALTLTAGAPLSGQSVGDPPAVGTAPASAQDVADNFAFEKVKGDRMTVPVSIDGKGPYRFLVDTGAERTVISEELARELSLGAGADARMHTMSGVGTVETVIIPKLKVSARTVKGINAPALSRYHLGAEGMLGVDSLQTQRVLFDFVKNTMTVSPSRLNEERTDPDTIVVTARSKFGRLILADARADGQKVWVIIDTGSQVSIGNEALRRKLAKKKRLAPTVPIELISVTGGVVKADYTKISGLIMGGVTLTDMPIAFADVHPFRKLGLTDQPALLLGMDALGVFDRVSVDFANRKVRFAIPDAMNRDATRMAALDPAVSAVR